MRALERAILRLTQEEARLHARKAAKIRARLRELDAQAQSIETERRRLAALLGADARGARRRGGVGRGPAGRRAGRRFDWRGFLSELPPRFNRRVFLQAAARKGVSQSKAKLAWSSLVARKVLRVVKREWGNPTVEKAAPRAAKAK